MPNINPKNFIFTKVGEGKLEKAVSQIKDFYEYTNILLDDYSTNLIQWASNEKCIGIKFINGFNNKSNKWQGYKIKTFSTLVDILTKIALYGDN